MRHLLPILLLLGGCAGQITRDANIGCARYDTLVLDAIVVAVNVDKGVIERGGVEVKADCSVTYGNVKP